MIKPAIAIPDASGEIELVAAIFETLRKDLHSKDPICQAAAQSWCDGAWGSIFFWADLLGMDAVRLRTLMMRGG